VIEPPETVITGNGQPVTVFAHGLGASIEQTRPFGSNVAGRRVFFAFRGHESEPCSDDATAPDRRWSYAELAAQLAAVADRTAAVRAVGVSLGAAALLRLVAADPDRFERLVFCLPAAVDRHDKAGAARLARLAELARRGDRAGLTELLLAEQPATGRDDERVRRWVGQQVTVLLRPDVVRGLTELPASGPVVEDPAALGLVRAPALVLAQAGDATHPVAVAEKLAATLPAARLEVLDEGGLLWRHRARVRALISGFLNA